MAGIRDLSNLRRQRRRARRGTSGGFGAAALVLALAMPVASCSSGGEGAAQAAPADTAERVEEVALPVVGALVRRGDLVLTIRTTGRVRAERQVVMRSESQGTVSEVLVEPGQRVAEGAVLVRLDPRPFDLAIREAEAGLADAQVRFTDLLLGDNAADASDVSQRRRENARLRSGIIGAEARLERARLDRERSEFRAPFAGTVDQVHVVVGQRVGPGDVVAELADLGSLYVEAAVLEHDLPLIRPGASAWVAPSAGQGRRLTGSVAAVLPLVDTTTRAGRVLVRVRSTSGMLRPGMYADVELEGSRLPDRVLVPAEAVIERDGRPLVFRARAGRSEWVYVSPGRSNARETEIMPDSASRLTPIAPGDTVLVGGHLTLTHDAPIRLQFVAQRGSR